MFGFLKNHLEQKLAKQAEADMLRRAHQIAPGRGPSSSAVKPFDRDQAIAHMQAQVAQPVSTERKALLANAMAVHRAKQSILDALDDESRAKLVAMAITTLLNQPHDSTKK